MGQNKIMPFLALHINYEFPNKPLEPEINLVF